MSVVLDPELAGVIASALASAPAWTSAVDGAFSEGPLRRILDRARTEAPAVRDAMIEALAKGVGEGDSYHASCIALTIGTILEWGADPQLAASAVLSRLHQVLERPSPDVDRYQRTVKFLGLAAMAMLAREIPVRKAARVRPGFASAVEGSRVDEAGFIAEILRLSDDLPLLLLHLERPEGFRVRLDGVASTHHLMTLLAELFPQWCEGDPVDPEVAAVARGERPMLRRVEDHARFHLFDYTGSDRHPGSSLWGEASPSRVAVFGDERIVLVGAKLFGARVWDGGFFANIHDALRSEVRIEATLSPAEHAAWLQRLPKGASVRG